MYTRGVTTRDIQGHLQEIYVIDVSPSLISQVTDAISEEVVLWQHCPLDEVYPIVYLDAVRIKVRHDSRVINKSVLLSVLISMASKKFSACGPLKTRVPSSFCLQVVTELKNRGVKDIFFACVDVLKGFPEAIESIFPKTQIQLCIVHMIRNSLNYVSWKQRKEVANDLKTIYHVPTVELAERNLESFAAKWDAGHPSITKSWRNNWERIVPLFSYSQEIRKAIYTINAIESLNMSLREVTKNRGHFPSDEAMFKLIYLALKKHCKKVDYAYQRLEIYAESVHYLI